MGAMTLNVDRVGIGSQHIVGAAVALPRVAYEVVSADDLGRWEILVQACRVRVVGRRSGRGLVGRRRTGAAEILVGVVDA